MAARLLARSCKRRLPQTGLVAWGAVLPCRAEVMHPAAAAAGAVRGRVHVNVQGGDVDKAMKEIQNSLKRQRVPETLKRKEFYEKPNQVRIQRDQRLAHRIKLRVMRSMIEWVEFQSQLESPGKNGKSAGSKTSGDADTGSFYDLVDEPSPELEKTAAQQRGRGRGRRR